MITSLVLPCYNPPAGWEQHVLASYREFCDNINEQVELILVVDGKSEKVTGEALNAIEQGVSKLKVVSYEQNRGKGYALRQGVAITTGELIMYTDIDFPYTINSMHEIYSKLSSGVCDVAIGIKNEVYYTQMPFLRRVISRNLRFLVRVFLSMPVTDTQCGLKGFRRVVAPVFLATTIDRYLFDLEFVRNCFKRKSFRVIPVQVVLNENVHFRSMNYRILIPEMANFIKLLFNSGK